MENELSKLLKKLRKASGYTQEFVSSKLGVVRQTYSHYETGRRIPTSEVVLKIADLYEIPLEDLLRISFNQDELIHQSIFRDGSKLDGMKDFFKHIEDDAIREKYKYLSRQEKEMLYYFEKLDDTGRKELIEIAKIKNRL